MKPFNLLAIDPGSDRSAFLWCRVEPPEEWALPFGVVPEKLYEWPNGALEWQLLGEVQAVAIETMHGIYIPARKPGKAAPPRVVGRDQMEAQFWGGFFAGRWHHVECRQRVSRSTATSVVCAEFGGKAKGDAAVKAALIDIYGGQIKAIGGGRCQTCKKAEGWTGRGHNPCGNCNALGGGHGDTGHESPRGVLHDWKGSHGFAALAVAIVAAQRIGKEI